MKSTNLLVPTTEDAFAVGRLEGLREAFTEIQTMANAQDIASLRIYLQARIKSLNDVRLTNPFTVKETDEQTTRIQRP